jgi:hypothetical protein
MATRPQGLTQQVAIPASARACASWREHRVIPVSQRAGFRQPTTAHPTGLLITAATYIPGAPFDCVVPRAEVFCERSARTLRALPNPVASGSRGFPLPNRQGSVVVMAAHLLSLGGGTARRAVLSGADTSVFGREGNSGHHLDAVATVAEPPGADGLVTALPASGWFRIVHSSSVNQS